MKKIQKIKWRTPIETLFLLLLGAILSTGCVKRELEYHLAGDNVVITLNWDSDPHPQTVRFLFYDQAGALFQEHTGLSDGYKGTLPAGTYRLVVHNEDAKQVDYRGMERYETAEVFALNTDYTLPGFREREIPCILEPQAVYGTGSCQEFETIKVHRDKLTSATVKPERLTRQVVFHFTVSSHEDVRSLTGVLNGVAPGIFIASKEENADHACAMEFTAVTISPQRSSALSKASSSAIDHNFAVHLNVFNLLSTETSPDGTNTISIVITLTDGRAFPLEIDLTPTLRDIIHENGGSIPIEIALDVKLVVDPESVNISSTVEEWKNGAGSDTEVD